jgi:DNA-directed RNA polymerase subunit beta'
LLKEEEYNTYKAQYDFRAGMGAQAIRELLEQLDLEREAEMLRKEIEEGGQ